MQIYNNLRYPRHIINTFNYKYTESSHKLPFKAVLSPIKHAIKHPKISIFFIRVIKKNYYICTVN